MSKNEFSCDCTVVHEDAVREAKGKMIAKEKIDALSALFKILGDPTRIKILCALDSGELCVCDIANILDMTKSAVSHQLSLLRSADLVRFRRCGKEVYYSLADDHVRRIYEMGAEHIAERG